MRELGRGLIGSPRCCGLPDLGGLEKEYVLGHKQRATLDQPPPQLECQSPQGWPAGTHVEERLLAVRAEALRPAEQDPEQFPAGRVKSTHRLLYERIAFGDDGSLAGSGVVASLLHHRLEAQQDRQGIIALCGHDEVEVVDLVAVPVEVSREGCKPGPDRSPYSSALRANPQQA